MVEIDSGEWAHQMVAQIQEGAARAADRRDRFAVSVDALGAGFARLAEGPWKPRFGAPARQDKKCEPLLFGQRRETALEVLRYETNINVWSAADQLRGFAVLLRAETSLMGAVTVARGVFEACLWAAAIIDPTVETETRIQRALTRRLARLCAGIRLSSLLESADEAGHGSDTRQNGDDAPAEADDSHGSARDPEVDIEDILALANQRGWKVVKDRRAPSIGSQLRKGKKITAPFRLLFELA